MRCRVKPGMTLSGVTVFSMTERIQKCSRREDFRPLCHHFT